MSAAMVSTQTISSRCTVQCSTSFKPISLAKCQSFQYRAIRSYAAIPASSKGSEQVPANPFGEPVGDSSSREAELERLEAKVRGAGVEKRASAVAVAKNMPVAPKAAPKRQIPIKGVTQPQQQQEESSEALAAWKDNSLVPEGWEQMNIGQRMYELYAGRRGVLFWANKSAYASVYILLGGWAIFRFILPALGLYKVDVSL